MWREFSEQRHLWKSRKDMGEGLAVKCTFLLRQWGSCGGWRRQAEKGAVITGKPASYPSERIGCLGPRLIHQTQRGDAGKESEKRTQDFTSAVQNLNNEAVGLVTVK